MIGTSLGRYEILESIGAGGMGEVYRARDTRLERDVALKVLPSGTLKNEATRKRFRKEALTLSQLNHPNVATVYDFDTQDDVDFLVMEYVPGTTLDELLEEGPLNDEEIARLGVQLAAGLEAAHREGVVHRDLKPGNLRVMPEGRLKILDFGLAKLVRPVSETAATVTLTGEGKVAGTLPYMAPEQLRGTSVDKLVDVYAAGAVLYEMATGRRAHQGEGQAELIDSILNKEPEPPRSVNQSVNVELEAVILKAMEKAPGQRYQSAAELGKDLERWIGGLGILAPPRRRPRRWPVAVAGVGLVALVVGLKMGEIKNRIFGPAVVEASIAVLPCENASGDRDAEYLADGFTDDLITQLAGIGSFHRVINTPTMLGYKDSVKPLREIADELAVTVMLSSRMRRMEGQIHFSAQLINPSTDEVLWADQYTREIKEVYVLQGEVTREIVNSLDLRLSRSERAALEEVHEVNPEAYHALKLGESVWHRASGRLEAQLQGIEHLERAVALDSTYVEAWSALSLSYGHLKNAYYWQGKIPYADIVEKADEYAWKAYRAERRVFELDPSSTIFGEPVEPGQQSSMTPDEVDRRVKRYLERHPGDARVHYYYAWALNKQGRFAEAIREHERAISLDPGSLRYRSTLGWQLIAAEEWDRAETHIEELLTMDPSIPDVHYQKMRLNLCKGRIDVATAAMTQALELQGMDPTPLLPLFQAIAGDHPVDERIHQIMKGVEDGFGPGIAAELYAYMGEKELMFDLIDRCFHHSMSRLDLSMCAYIPFRDEPRFQEYLKRWREEGGLD